MYSKPCNPCHRPAFHPATLAENGEPTGITSRRASEASQTWPLRLFHVVPHVEWPRRGLKFLGGGPRHTSTASGSADPCDKAYDKPSTVTIIIVTIYILIIVIYCHCPWDYD